jgi:hypothetical protein
MGSESNAKAAKATTTTTTAATDDSLLAALRANATFVSCMSLFASVLPTTF